MTTVTVLPPFATDVVSTGAPKDDSCGVTLNRYRPVACGGDTLACSMSGTVNVTLVGVIAVHVSLARGAYSIR